MYIYGRVMQCCFRYRNFKYKNYFLNLSPIIPIHAHPSNHPSKPKYGREKRFLSEKGAMTIGSCRSLFDFQKKIEGLPKL